MTKLETILKKDGSVCAPPEWNGNSLRNQYARSEINVGFEALLIRDARAAHFLLADMWRIHALLDMPTTTIEQHDANIAEALRIAKTVCAES